MTTDDLRFCGRIVMGNGDVTGHLDRLVINVTCTRLLGCVVRWMDELQKNGNNIL